VDSGYRSIMSVINSLVIFPIFAYGTGEQKRKFLPKLASGEIIGCFGLTEPDHGSDPGGMRTRAVKSDGGYILKGAKTWISNAPSADIFVIWAKTEDGVIRGFLVERGAKGLSTPKIEGKFSLRSSPTGEVVMEDVFVPDENMFPESSGLKGPCGWFNKARYGIAWGAIGAAMACYDEVLRYTKERLVQGGPLAGKQLTQEKLVFMLTEITKAQLLALRLAQIKDAGKLHHTMVSMAKRNNVDIALQIARKARDLLGANGIVDDYQTMRHMMNLETVRTYEGTHDVHMLILGKEITGLSAI